jgi:hypothetical protein
VAGSLDAMELLITADSDVNAQNEFDATASRGGHGIG